MTRRELLGGAVCAAPVKRTVKVDCGFPGGNIVVEAIAGDKVQLHQDLRDTEGDWFYWYFRVRGGDAIYILRHDVRTDAWELVLYRSERL